MRAYFIVIATISVIVSFGCTGGDRSSAHPSSPFRCEPIQAAPYDETTPYLGIHGDPGNSDVVPCDIAPEFEEAWHVLEGRAIPQPSTFSPDGDTVYVTTFPIESDPCTVFALSAETGDTLWCKPLPRSVAASAVEVDDAGDLFLAAASTLHSYSAAGNLRWSTVLDDGDGSSLTHRTYGVHFTPSGYLATVTVNGRLILVARETGQIVAEMNLPEVYQFVSPEPSVATGLDLVSFFPDASRDDLEEAYGGREQANITLSSFFGVSGQFTDNTVAISQRDEIYVQGGGPSPEDGAMIQVLVSQDDGAISLERGWYVPVGGGSAASPSISRNGKYMVYSDGAASGSALSQNPTPAYVAIVDIEACNANTDTDEDQDRCAPIAQKQLERGSMSGAPPIADDGTVYYWEAGIDFKAFYGQPDLFRLGPDGESSQVVLPDDRDWTSVMTVTNNYLVGSVSKYTESDTSLLQIVLASEVSSSLVIVDRESLEIRWEAPLTDDSTSTVSIDRRGGLYVSLFGLLSTIATEQRPTLGLVKFTPAQMTPED